MDAADQRGLYGDLPDGLKMETAGALQLSPLVPGAGVLEELAPGSLTGLTMLAPSQTMERRYVIALGLKALVPDAPFVIAAPKDKGGARLGAELEAFGCRFEESGRRHHRICVGTRPADPQGLADAIAAGRPRLAGDLGLWTQPGLFSWDRIDPGTALLTETLPPLSGRGADFGCGLGVLAAAVLRGPKVKGITLVDIDRRAIEVAKHNVDDPRAAFRWADLRTGIDGLANLDFVVVNPPFHQGGTEDRGLGQSLIASAAKALRRSGALWLVANRHLPYEAALKPLFARVETRAEANGFKVIEARK